MIGIPAKSFKLERDFRSEIGLHSKIISNPSPTYSCSQYLGARKNLCQFDFHRKKVSFKIFSNNINYKNPSIINWIIRNLQNLQNKQFRLLKDFKVAIQNSNKVKTIRICVSLSMRVLKWPFQDSKQARPIFKIPYSYPNTAGSRFTII